MHEAQKQMLSQMQQPIGNAPPGPINSLPGAVERLEDLNQRLRELDNLLQSISENVGACPVGDSTESKGCSASGHINVLHYQIDNAFNHLNLVCRQVTNLSEVLV